MKKLILSSILIVAATVALAVDQPIYRTKAIQTSTRAIATATASNFVNGAIIPISRGQNVGVQFNMAGSGASTANGIVYFQVSQDSTTWSSALVGATNALNGTAQVSSIITLTNGVSFPSTARFIKPIYYTNSSTVSLYSTNVIVGVWDAAP